MTGPDRAWAGTWSNPPAAHSVEDDGILHATSGDRTDFWQGTFYGFRRDDGHALLRDAPDAFEATLRFDGAYRHLYDQAGLMLRVGPRDWIKFGVEHTDGVPHLSVVVTRDGASDWSAQPVALDGPMNVRAIRTGDAVLLRHRTSHDRDWAMARLAPAPAGPVRVGPYLCSPERAGFRAAFHAMTVTVPEAVDLHG
ncbi:DUF1349 domain-containing protein [Jannaschia sp. LMIT008]|uniref:DUF1349 domain-containing protein n=1 Tax=Jannaschia maritima TaxID=3032585 RepID=UPI002811AB19|nr:DUF1349 domain-containing protein [Jannaschia sp. LMIT008]